MLTFEYTFVWLVFVESRWYLKMYLAVHLCWQSQAMWVNQVPYDQSEDYINQNYLKVIGFQSPVPGIIAILCH